MVSVPFSFILAVIFASKQGHELWTSKEWLDIVDGMPFPFNKEAHADPKTPRPMILNTDVERVRVFMEALWDKLMTPVYKKATPLPKKRKGGKGGKVVKPIAPPDALDGAWVNVPGALAFFRGTGDRNDKYQQARHNVQPFFEQLWAKNASKKCVELVDSFDWHPRTNIAKNNREVCANI
jgi:hypothetical protein